MNRARQLCCVLATALVFSGTVRAADSLEDVEKKILAATEKVKSWSAKMVTTSDMDGPGMKMQSKVDGVFESAKRGDKMLFRMDSKSVSVIKAGDQETKSESKILAISDGEFFYTLTEAEGQKMAMKMKPDSTKNQLAGQAMFEEMNKMYDLKLLPDDKVGGKDVYVIGAAPKKTQPDTTEEHKFYYAKDSGICIKSVTQTKSPQSKMTAATEYSDVKLNPEIKPERFVFKAPDGVAVQDMTKLAASEPAEQEQPAEKPAAENQTGADKDKPAADTDKKDNAKPKSKDSKKPKIGLPKKLPGL